MTLCSRIGSDTESLLVAECPRERFDAHAGAEQEIAYEAAYGEPGRFEFVNAFEKRIYHELVLLIGVANRGHYN